jgi:hypothetical protein
MKLATCLCLISLFVVSSTCLAQIAPPRPGVDMPQAYFEQIGNDKTSFQFRNAWIQKAARVKNNRQQFLADPHSRPMNLLSPDERRELAVSGTVSVPVFMAMYANTGSAPYPVANLQTELFNGPWPTGTMTGLYNEMSYGSLTLIRARPVSLSKRSLWQTTPRSTLLNTTTTGRMGYPIRATTMGSLISWPSSTQRLEASAATPTCGRTVG